MPCWVLGWPFVIQQALNIDEGCRPALLGTAHELYNENLALEAAESWPFLCPNLVGTLTHRCLYYSLSAFNLFLCRAAKHADKTVVVIPDLHEKPSVRGDVQSSISEEISWNVRPLLLWRGRRSWNRGWKKMAGLKMVELCKMVVGFEDIIAHCVIITIRKWSQTHRISLPIRSGTLLEVLLFLCFFCNIWKVIFYITTRI